MKKIFAQFMILACIVVVSALPVQAQQNQDDRASTVDKTQAAERAKQKENGRVLRVDQSRNKYRVKVLKKSGRVVSVDVDKRSGQVESPQDKDAKR